MTQPRTTPQDVFDTVARAMLSQGQRSANAKGGLYAQGNLRCAVGLLLTSNDTSEVEGVSVLDGRVQALLPFEASTEVVSLLDYLQRLHDRVDPKDWERGLSVVADLTGLKTPSTKSVAA